ncbi:unnamed protein product [Calicophoron daubneyi]|uniref:UDP-N-acetylglucosamine transferase subunit ALG14 n=1 Tax=Calicophoron daubneyi TaxID=300641 RepID=A0AAV2T4E2_CALDB
MITGSLIALSTLLLVYYFLRSIYCKSSDGLPTMIILGSGGHTAEMLSFVKSLDKMDYPRIYVTADTDTLSEQKAKAVELQLCGDLKQILCNGPSTCVPLCLAAVIFDILFFRHTLIVYVESICRTQTLSLSAKILYYSRCVDVIVQWPELHSAYPRTVYLGLLS